MFGFIDKLFATFICVPPLYMLFRFVRWWIRQELKPQEISAPENTET